MKPKDCSFMQSASLKRSIALLAILNLSIWSLGAISSTTVRAQETQELKIIDTLVSADGFRLNFRIIKGGSPTVLFEAGGGMDLAEWDEIAPKLARRTGVTVVAYDRAGFGKSDLPEHPCDMKAEATWLWESMKRLGFERNIILVGHSYGGWMVRLEASENPAAVSGIVFIDPFSAEFVDLLGVEYLDQHPMTGKIPFDTSQPEKLTKQQRALVRMVTGGLSPKMAVMKKTAVPKNIPVYIIKAGLPTFPKEDEQKAWNEALDRMAASIDGSVMIVAEKSNHMIPFMQPDLIVETVIKAIHLAKSK